jgi:mRNA-degrading endonuclease HigB of HigAB toxin-antitoxin module
MVVTNWKNIQSDYINNIFEDSSTVDTAGKKTLSGKKLVSEVAKIKSHNPELIKNMFPDNPKLYSQRYNGCYPDNYKFIIEYPLHYWFKGIQNRIDRYHSFLSIKLNVSKIAQNHKILNISKQQKQIR